MPMVPYATPSLLGAINGIELTSSHPSAPAALIHESRPLTMPSSLSLKTTIRSKYSHCIVLTPSFHECSTRERLLGNLGLGPALVQPARGDSQHLVVELKFHMVEPARQVTDKAILMLNLGVQVVRDIAQFGLRKARLQSLCTLEDGGDIALGIKQQARTIMGRHGTEGSEQLHHIPRVRLTYARTGESLKHPLTLRRDGHNHRG